MRKSVTLKDLAKELGLSVGTICKALNNSSEISEKTKTKVKKTALKKGYVTNFLGNALKNNPMKIIGVTLPQTKKLDYPKLLDEIFNASQLKKSQCSLYQPKNKNNDLTLISQISNGNVQGIIVLFSNE
jgi:LacI family transcriptional regulator